MLDMASAEHAIPSHVFTIRHTSEVKISENIHAEIKSDLEKAGLTLTRLLRITNDELLARFDLESEQLRKTKQKDKGFQLNIQNLYHGTTAPLGQICDEGLDERLSRHGRFGRGIYFSDNPTKCYKYAQSRSSREPYLLRCRVILGDIKEYPAGKQDETLTREPEKGVMDGKRVYYDSVKGCPADHTEYVIYEKRRVLLEYIAFYSTPNCLKLHRSHTTPSKTSVNSSRPSSDKRSGNPLRSGSDSPRRSSSRSSSENSVNSDDERMDGLTSSSSIQHQGCDMPCGTENAPGLSSSKSAPSMSAMAGLAEQQRLAFQQMLQYKGKVSDSDMDGLVKSFLETYGSIPGAQSSLDAGESKSEEVAQVDSVLEDDPVNEVKRSLVLQFKEVTSCNDDDLSRQYIENYGMDLNAAIQAFVCGGID